MDQVLLASRPFDDQVLFRSSVPATLSFFSSKFSNKMTYINHLGQLNEHIQLETIPIPVEVKR